jgi:hypothetical protein
VTRRPSRRRRENTPAVARFGRLAGADLYRLVHPQGQDPAWKTKRSWYMVGTADRSINWEQERMMAKRADAKTVEVKASHVAYMSHPRGTAKLIEEAATSATVNQ